MSTPSRLTFVDTFRHGILGGSDPRFAFLFLLLAGCSALCSSRPPSGQPPLSASAPLPLLMTGGKNLHPTGPKLGVWGLWALESFLHHGPSPVAFLHPLKKTRKKNQTLGCNWVQLQSNLSKFAMSEDAALAKHRTGKGNSDYSISEDSRVCQKCLPDPYPRMLGNSFTWRISRKRNLQEGLAFYWNTVLLYMVNT